MVSLEHHPEKPKNWNEVLGPFYRRSNLSETLSQDKGLIILETSDRTEVCPAFQFDTGDQGEVHLNPHIATAWRLLSVLQISQLGESPWTKAGALTQNRPEYVNRSWADMLKDPGTTDTTRSEIFKEIVDDAAYAAMLLSVQLTDPRRSLQE